MSHFIVKNASLGFKRTGHTMEVCPGSGAPTDEATLMNLVNKWKT